MVLLDRSSSRAADTDTIATHNQSSFLALVIKHRRIHRFRIFGAQLEHVTNFDSPPDLQLTGAARTIIASNCFTQINKSFNLEITAMIGTSEMEVLLVGTETEIAHHRQVQVGNDPARNTDRSREAGWCPGDFSNKRFVSQLDVIAIEEVTEFDFVKLMITAQQHSHSLFTLILEHEGFNHLLRFLFQESCDVFDAFQMGRRDLTQIHGRSGSFTHRGSQLCFLDIGGVVTTVTGDNGILAGIGKHHELMREAAANSSGIRFYGPELQTAAFKDSSVSLVHFLIRDIGTGIIDIEGISILHDEFPTTHQTKAWADLVTEFGLNLVQVQRQLTI